MSGHFSATLVDNVDWIDGVQFRIRHGFRYYLTEDENGEFVDVARNFSTNFASTPRVIWALLPPTGRYSQAAATHDKLFKAPVIRSAHSARPCTLGEANRIFVDGAKALGVSWLVRRLMYRMLQAFSQASWDRYRAEDARIGSTTTIEHEVSSDAQSTRARSDSVDPAIRPEDRGGLSGSSGCLDGE